ncbi:MAG: MarR family transcriptional regulator [Nitrososphaerota archaeon]|jgi:predicted transcriptional regulator|nr:MarR family transcriptional regulator [Nitrososphaerota archaeon]MDG6903989.1 MarR family transcriptional regulator [Nitrososphaerota archaeon]MDG6911621.1 MarR family transcriptional regulator [Nitrososphaerota archaeon]MDG6940525.1 MarR family transcriptional regulator [Nitrososphaerota archaeon]MDG6960835.1 MarR family transcriptional regulator [Nitrososphaerota archaeon]
MTQTCCPVSVCDSPDCLQLTEREAMVCMAICSSQEPVAFSTLKTALGYHQEVVSRILKRLMDHGAIEKTRGRYQRAGQ